VSFSKYRAKRTEIDGKVFHSGKEARRYAELKTLERAGYISGLELQPKLPIEICGEHLCNYIADFKYWEDGTLVIEDVKGVRTPTFNLKWKAVQIQYRGKAEFRIT
jgi:hypothetical protein